MLEYLASEKLFELRKDVYKNSYTVIKSCNVRGKEDMQKLIDDPSEKNLEILRDDVVAALEALYKEIHQSLIKYSDYCSKKELSQ